ncbi:MAG: type II secretion system protein [Patescibacteria group bacterium]|nr:type II secretion system protein [Patescibacteria group bacterium]
MRRRVRGLGGQRGALLIEVVIVLTIVTALTAIILVSIGVAQQKSRDTDRITDLNSIRKALSIYMDDRGTFPQGEGFLLGQSNTRSLCENGWSHRCEGRPFMLHVPGGRAKAAGKCEISQDEYVYSQREDGRSYDILFCFEGDIGGYGGGIHTADPFGIR